MFPFAVGLPSGSDNTQPQVAVIPPHQRKVEAVVYNIRVHPGIKGEGISVRSPFEICSYGAHFVGISGLWTSTLPAVCPV